MCQLLTPFLIRFGTVLFRWHEIFAVGWMIKDEQTPMGNAMMHKSMVFDAFYLFIAQKHVFWYHQSLQKLY